MSEQNEKDLADLLLEGLLTPSGKFSEDGLKALCRQVADSRKDIHKLNAQVEILQTQVKTHDKSLGEIKIKQAGLN